MDKDCSGKWSQKSRAEKLQQLGKDRQKWGVCHLGPMEREVERITEEYTSFLSGTFTRFIAH